MLFNLLKLKELYELKYILIHKNSSKDIKEFFYKKFDEYLGYISQTKHNIKIYYY